MAMPARIAMDRGEFSIATGAIVGREYLGSDGTKRRIEDFEYWWGNWSIKVWDYKLERFQWLTLKEWNEVRA